MPLLRYFVVAGGALLALLFIADAALPLQPLPGFLNAASSDLPPFRIHSDQKWPQRIAFDTSMPAVRPAAVAEVILPAAPAAGAGAAPQDEQVRNAFAQLAPAARKTGARTNAGTQIGSKVQELRPQSKGKVAKARPSRPPVRVAQQPHVGLFDFTW